VFPQGRQAEDLRPALARLRAPVLVVWGAEDRVMPVAHSEGLPGNVTLHRLEGAGHMPQMEAAATVNRLLAEHAAAAEGP
jgi:pyruvate dehydrogenase E2 component (dihydrolipoamide acetyltransferase)